MPAKKDIGNYIQEKLKKGYTKQQIKAKLVKTNSEKEVMKRLIEVAEPKLLKQYKKPHNILVIFAIIALFLRFYYGFIEGTSIGEELGLGIQFGIILGLVALLLPVLFFMGLMKNRGWGYVAFFFYGILNLLYSIPEILISFFGEIPVDQSVDISVTAIRIAAIIFSSINFIIYLGLTVFSFYCWKKIHPDYKVRNVLDAGAYETGRLSVIYIIVAIFFVSFISLIILGLFLGFIRNMVS